MVDNFKNQLRYVKAERNSKGGWHLPQLKKILVTVPESLLQEVDRFVSNDKTNRSELIREAMKLYIKEKKKAEMTERMKKGYQEMAKINLQFAEICFEADQQQLDRYEEKLAECE